MSNLDDLRNVRFREQSALMADQFVQVLGSFHDGCVDIQRIPSINSRRVNLLLLQRMVDDRGGFEQVCLAGKWVDVAMTLGYDDLELLSNVANGLKICYQSWLLPYEEWFSKDRSTYVKALLEYEPERMKNVIPKPQSSHGRLREKVRQMQTP
jgi:hypothetical protein